MTRKERRELRRQKKKIPRDSLPPAKALRTPPERHSGKTTGAISKYHPKYDTVAEQACKRWGFGNDELAHLFRVSPESISEWYYAYPTFRQSVLKGRDEWDGVLVESALKKRATGFEYQETTETHTVLKLKDGKQVDKNGRPITVEVPVIQRMIQNRYMPPDPNAAIFWLCNRQRDRWRSKDKLAMLEGGDGPLKIPTVLDLDTLTHEELKTLRELLTKASEVAIHPAGRKPIAKEITAGVPPSSVAER